jgi:hypothetical protein
LRRKLCLPTLIDEHSPLDQPAKSRNVSPPRGADYDAMALVLGWRRSGPSKVCRRQAFTQHPAYRPQLCRPGSSDFEGVRSCLTASRLSEGRAM